MSDTSDRMANGSYPITTQHEADAAWKLRGRSKDYSEAQVVAHIRAMVKKHGLTMPGQREKAAMGAHGFVWPDGMPDCSLCDREPNDPVHVTPPRDPQPYGAFGEMTLTTAADKSSSQKMPVRSHAYTPNVPMITRAVTCQACGNQLGNGIHVVGMPAGMAPASSNSGMYGGGVMLGGVGSGGSPFSSGPTLAHAHEPVDGLDACVVCGDRADAKTHLRTPVRTREVADLSDGSAYDLAQRALTLMAIADEALDQAQPLLASALGMPNPDADDEASEGEKPQQAFVAEIGQRLVFAAPGSASFDPAQLPREIASAWQKASAANPYNLWVTGRYVEADRPNRNMAYWSTADLEIGQPSVTHGPVNWNHQEKEIIGAIAASELVKVDRQTAATTGVGNHIVALAAIWGYIYPERARAVQMASESGRLWYSMECISKSVACLAGSCGHEMSYGDYMRRQDARCEHMRDGAPRRFVDPTFGGGAMIVPPVRPGWANADARVLKQAAALAERQAAAFGSLSTTDAELLVAQLLQNGER